MFVFYSYGLCFWSKFLILSHGLCVWLMCLMIYLVFMSLVNVFYSIGLLVDVFDLGLLFIFLFFMFLI